MKHQYYKFGFVFIFALCLSGLQAQTMYVRPTSGSQMAYPVENIHKLTFENGNLIVSNTSGPNSTFSLVDNRYINFMDLSLATNNSLMVDSKFYVYPNPSSQILNIANANPTQTPSLVVIISIDGKLLMQQKPSAEVTQVDISTLTQGIYLCKIISNNQQQTLKFLRQ